MWLPAQALEEQIGPYLPDWPGGLGSLRGEAMATGACGRPIYGAWGMWALAGRLEKMAVF